MDDFDKNLARRSAELAKQRELQTEQEQRRAEAARIDHEQERVRKSRLEWRAKVLAQDLNQRNIPTDCELISAKVQYRLFRSDAVVELRVAVGWRLHAEIEPPDIEYKTGGKLTGILLSVDGDFVEFSTSPPRGTTPYNYKGVGIPGKIFVNFGEASVLRIASLSSMGRYSSRDLEVRLAELAAKAGTDPRLLAARRE